MRSRYRGPPHAVRLVGLPLRQYSHQLGCILQPFRPRCLWQSSPSKVTAIKMERRLFLCSGSQPHPGRWAKRKNGMPPEPALSLPMGLTAFARLGKDFESQIPTSRRIGEMWGTPIPKDRQFVAGVGLAGYFSLATTNSGAQSNARLISESGKGQMALRADSAYSVARREAASNEP